MYRDCDLLIIGGGPAGLSCAINAASEGLSVTILDSAMELGGQASKSSLIENYPGFYTGISGADLTTACITQADKFGTQIVTPCRVVNIRIDGDKKIILTEDGDEFTCKSVVLAMGLSYRRLDVAGIGRLMGRGVFYGVPPKPIIEYEDTSVIIVGGANSAGQAARQLASNPKINVIMVVRSTLSKGMSRYLIDRITKTKNILVIENTEIGELIGCDRLIGFKYKSEKTGEVLILDCSAMFIFIGATPKTQWLRGCGVDLDQYGFIRTGQDIKRDSQGEATPFETSIKGVFAVGDVRYGSVKRIASAVGEGAVVVPGIHKYLNRR